MLLTQTPYEDQIEPQIKPHSHASVSGSQPTSEVLNEEKICLTETQPLWLSKPNLHLSLSHKVWVKIQHAHQPKPPVVAQVLNKEDISLIDTQRLMVSQT